MKKAFEACNPELENNQIRLAHFLSHFINIIPLQNNNILPSLDILELPSFKTIYEHIDKYQLDFTKQIDGQVWFSIRLNKLVEEGNYELRNNLFNFGHKIKLIQHYSFHSKLKNLTKLLGKLLTRIWWIYHSSSPIM